MKFDTSIPFELEKAKAYLEKLIGKKIEIKKETEHKTTQQNAYLHVLFSIYALEYGWSLDECKIVVKRELGLYYDKNGKKFVRSISDLSKEETSEFIEKFRNWASTQGCYLPEPNEYNEQIDNYIKKNGEYL